MPISRRTRRGTLSTSHICRSCTARQGLGRGSIRDWDYRTHGGRSSTAEVPILIPCNVRGAGTREITIRCCSMRGRLSESFWKSSRVGGNKAMPAAIFRSSVALLGIAMLLVGGAAAFASTLKFKADMSGGGEAPPNNSSGKAHLEATLDTDSNTLAWTVTYSGLTGAPIGAHFHGPVS